MLYYPRRPSLVTCSSLDAAGDPGVALCGGWADTDAVGAALRQLRDSSSSGNSSGSSSEGRLDVFIQPATGTNRTAAAANASAAPATATATAGGRVALAAVPALAPYFASGALVPLAPRELAAAEAEAALAAESNSGTHTTPGAARSNNASTPAAFITTTTALPFFTYLSPDLSGAACPDMEWGMSWGQRQQLLQAVLEREEVAAEGRAGGGGGGGGDEGAGVDGDGDGDADDK